MLQNGTLQIILADHGECPNIGLDFIYSINKDWCSQRSALPFAYDPVHGHVNKPCATKPICHLGTNLTNSLKETLFSLVAKEPGELGDRGDR
jgi:hypothetical protein